MKGKLSKQIKRGNPTREIAALRGPLHTALGIPKDKFDKMSLDQIDVLVKKKLAERDRIRDEQSERLLLGVRRMKSMEVPTDHKAVRRRTKEVAMRQFGAIMKKKVGINIPSSKLEEAYDLALQSIPKLNMKPPKGFLDAVEVTVERDGVRHTLVEARQPEVIGIMRSKKKRGWRNVAKLPCRKGMMSIAQLAKKPNVVSLGYRGGAHYDYHITTPYEISFLADFFTSLKKQLLKKGVLS